MTEIWIIIVSVLVPVLLVSLLSFILNRSYRKRRPLTDTEEDVESNDNQSSNIEMIEVPPSLSSPEEDLEADYEPPPSPYCPEKALQDLADYQREYLNRRPDNGQSSMFLTSRFGTVVRHVASNFSNLPGARPSFSFDPIHNADAESNTPPISLSTTAVIDFGSEEYLALHRECTSTAHEPKCLQSAHPLRRNGVRTEGLQSSKKSLPRAPRREIGPENGLGEVEKIFVDVRVRKEGGNGFLRRASREVDLRGRMLEVN